MNIRTVLFDLDGTLIDTNELIITSFMYTFEKYGLNFTREETKKFNGPPLNDTFYKLDPNRAEEMIATYRKHNIEHHDQYVKPFPNVVETVSTLHEAGYKLGVVTTKLQPTVNMGLELTGLDKYFETVIALNDVENPKPHPEPIHVAMEELGAEKESTIMVGDNYHDIVAGHNAGVYTAGVSWSEKGREFVESYEPTVMLDDMSELLPIVGVKSCGGRSGIL